MTAEARREAWFRQVRIWIACICAVDQVVGTVLLWTSAGAARLPPMALLLALGRNRGLYVALAALTIGLLAWWGRSGRWRVAVAALALQALLFEASTTVLGRIEAERFPPGLALLGWVCGVAAARYLRSSGVWAGGAPRDLDGFLGVRGATAAVSAMYVISGLSKLVESGPGWVGPGHLRALVLSRSPLPLDSPLNAAILATTWVPTALAAAALVIELSAVFAVVGPRARLAVGLALVGMHLGMFVTAGLLAVSTLLVAWPLFVGDGLAQLRRGTPQLPEADPQRLRRALVRLAVVGGLVAVAAWVLPVRQALQTAPFHQRSRPR